jgi:hypothetical protein
MGWCNHPKRRTGSDVRIYVRSNELPCRNDWAVDLWEQTSLASSDVILDAVASPVLPATVDQIEFLAANAQRPGLDPDPSGHAGRGEDIVLGDLTSLVARSDEPALEETRRLRRAHEQMRVRNRERRTGVLPLVGDAPPLMPTESGLWLTGDLVGRRSSTGDGSETANRATASIRPGPDEVSPVALGEMGRPFPQMTTFPEDDERFSSIPVPIEGIELPLATRAGGDQRVLNRAGFENDREITPWHTAAEHQTSQSNIAFSQSDPISIGVDAAGTEITIRRPLEMQQSAVPRESTTSSNDKTSADQATYVDPQKVAAFRSDTLTFVRDADRGVAVYEPDSPPNSTEDAFGDSTESAGWEEKDNDRPEFHEIPLRLKRPNARALSQNRDALPSADEEFATVGDSQVLERPNIKSVSVEDADHVADQWMSIPRMCSTCRDFRPAENGERGWCTNKWAFSHRRMVDADELPCETSIGGWWLPHDDHWMSSVDVTAHSQPTPLLDQWLAQRAAANGEIDVAQPARRRQRS